MRRLTHMLTPLLCLAVLASAAVVTQAELQPAANSRLIYVSPDGQDDNTGLAPDQAVRTVDHGFNLLRDDHSDWLLLARGAAYGLTSTVTPPGGDQIVITSYGNGSVPELHVGPNRRFFEPSQLAADNVVVHEVTIKGLRPTIYHAVAPERLDVPAGLIHLPIFSDWYVTRNRGSLDREHFAKQLHRIEGDMLIIGHLRRDDGWRPVRPDHEQGPEALERWVELLEYAAEIRPDLKVGVYFNWPFHMRQFSQPLTEQQWANIRARNDFAQPAADAAGLIVPSLYALSAEDLDSGAWGRRSEMVLAEAERMAKGKPVVPFIWGRWRQGDRDVIDTERIQFMLDWLLSRGYSPAVWTDTGDLPWSQNDPWVQAAQDPAPQ